MDCEIKTLHDNRTWELTKLPHDPLETKGRWVYTIKQGKQPGNVQYKAKYVARGFSQIQGLYYEETFSPTTRFTSIRMLLQKVTNENLHITPAGCKRGIPERSHWQRNLRATTTRLCQIRRKRDTTYLPFKEVSLWT